MVEISLETNTKATKEIPTLNQSRRGCNCLTSNCPYQGQPTKSHILSDDLRPLATIVVRYWALTISSWSMWQIIHSWLIECSFWDNSWDLHSGIPVSSRILLSDINGQAFCTVPHLNHPWTDAISEIQLASLHGQYGGAWSVCPEIESNYERHLLMWDGCVLKGLSRC